MATGTVTLYNNAKLKMVDGTIDLDNDSFKVILLSNSHSFVATHTQLSDVSANEIATGNGYTQQTKTLSSINLSESGGTVTFDAADVSWTASGGSITASHAVVYDDTTTGDLLLFGITFSAEESAGTGTDFNIIWDASGIFTMS